MRYSSTHANDKLTGNSTSAGSNAHRTMPAVPVLQKAQPEEELQMKSAVVQKADTGWVETNTQKQLPAIHAKATGEGRPIQMARSKTTSSKKKIQHSIRVKKSERHNHSPGAIMKGLPQGRHVYEIGQHGAKSREQKRLLKLYKMNVTGSTHESEHTIGYAVLAGGHLPRGESKDAQVLENMAPAYQEVKALHRDHIGTGSKSERDETGMNANEYREMQRGLLTGDSAYNEHLKLHNKNIGVSPTEERNAVSNAVQINQLGYGQQLRQRNYSHLNKTALEQAHASYRQMVMNMKSVTYAKDATTALSVAVPDASKLEMILARHAAITGNWPKVQAEQLNQLIEQYEKTNKWPEAEIESVISLLK